jgi:hypothetical protein
MDIGKTNVIRWVAALCLVFQRDIKRQDTLKHLCKIDLWMETKLPIKAFPLQDNSLFNNYDQCNLKVLHHSIPIAL